MSDRLLNQFVSQGTAAERAAFTPDPPTPATGPDSGYFWLETDTGKLWAWDSSSSPGEWVQVADAPLGYTALKAGKHMVPIMAAAMTARTTNGAASGTSESATNKVMQRTLDFDQSTDEFAQIMVPMPKSWNEDTITARFRWTSGLTTGNVVWAIQAVAISDDDPLDAAFGTAVTVTDGMSATAGDLMISAETGAVTIGGAPAEGDLVCIQVYRDADNGADTLAGDAKLIAVDLFITYNAADDA